MGDETSTKIKLRKKLHDVENGKKTEPGLTRINHAPSKIHETVTNLPKTQPDDILCSICAVSIQGFVQEYFMGEKFNPACTSCKRNDSSYDADDPYSSFPGSTLPPSLVSHWLPSHYNTTQNQNPSSITSLVTHCALLPNPGDKIITFEEALQIIRESFGKVIE